MSNRVFEEYEPDSDVEKLIKKSRDSPFVPIGIAGFCACAAWGAYNYKNRGKMSTSMYLMQLRVMGQGAVVGALCLGLIYSMSSRYLMHKEESAEKK